MKRVLMFLALGIFLLGFTAAAYDVNKTPQMAVGKVDSSRPNQVQANFELRKQIREGQLNIEGKALRIEYRENNRIRLQSEGISADTDLELEEDKNNSHTKLRAKLSNGKIAEIKIMPNTASATALARLRLKVCSLDNNCTIELKEVGERNQTRAVYEIKAEKRARIFGLFKARMRLESQIDAETGEVIRTKRPWWSFLATEEDEVSEEILQEALQE
jgi:hypothetical protein